MSDESDREGSVVSGDARISLGEVSDESRTEDGNDFLDLEAEESGESDEDDDSNLDSDAFEHPSFPQFSSLPAELRLMIWEAVDPYLKFKGRVMEFRVVDDDGQLWETATVEPQTAPARTLLATNRESRGIALKHYPDVIQLRRGRGYVRFDSNYDIILLTGTYFGAQLPGVARWCSKVQHLAYNVDNWPIDPASLEGFENLKRVFVCGDGSFIKRSEFEKKIVPNPLNLFWLELMEEETSIGEDMWQLFCWPDKTSRANFAEIISEGYRQLNSMPSKIGSVPLWGMVRFLFGSAIEAYAKLGYTASNPPPTEPPPGEGWSDWPESESESESEPDEYELDGFVVDSSSEGSEDPGDDGDNDVDGDSDDANDGEPQAWTSHEDFESFHGFSPLQEDPNDFETSEQLPAAATFSSLEPESPKDHISVTSSSEEQPVAAKESSRFKRRVISSDDEDGGEEGTGPDVENRSRPKKRARVVLSNSEDDDEDEHNDMRKNHPRDDQLGKDDEDDDNEDDITDEDEEEDDTEEEAEPRASKPMSLLARLRQFCSDVPVSPEGDSPTSTGDEYGREGGYERDDDDEDGDMDGEGALLDAEYPDSAEEDVEDDGW